MSKKPTLGKGLSSLLGEMNETGKVEFTRVPLGHICFNPDQPRRNFDEKQLEELAESIKHNGVVQPIIVRPDTNGTYQIIAGERRYRAAIMANLDEIPVVIVDADDKKVMELAIIENVQRTDLSPIEEAQAYLNLMKKHSYTQEALSNILGKSRSHVANLLRLLNLPDEVKQMIDEGKISVGHAKMLVGTEDPLSLANDFIKQKMSVSDAASYLKGHRPTNNNFHTPSNDLLSVENEIRNKLGLRCEVRPYRDGSGKVILSYNNLEELDIFLQKITEIN